MTSEYTDKQIIKLFGLDERSKEYLHEVHEDFHIIPYQFGVISIFHGKVDKCDAKYTYPFDLLKEEVTNTFKLLDWQMIKYNDKVLILTSTFDFYKEPRIIALENLGWKCICAYKDIQYDDTWQLSVFEPMFSDETYYEYIKEIEEKFKWVNLKTRSLQESV